jgi:isopenicillin N synthase-like dioxygenase
MVTRQSTLPVIDMAVYHSDKTAFVEELRRACHSVGVFLIRHDLKPILADQMLEETRRFFSFPINQKNQIAYTESASFRGFMELGVENTSGKVDHREQIEYAVEYPSTTEFHISESSRKFPFYERLKSPTNPWPTFQPSLQPVTVEFAKEVCHIADCIRDSLCLALNLDPNILSHKFTDSSRKDEVPHWVIKMVSYPPKNNAHTSHRQEEGEEGEERQGVGAHTDSNFLTLVLQDQIGGLQAFSQGKWVDVTTEFGSSVLVCNLGEQAQTWSRGYFLATPHRVLRNASSKANRISVPLFYNPILSATMEPLPESELSKISWDRAKNDKHWTRQDNTMLTSVGENTFKSLARSHPTVFRKHHPDLTILKDGQIVPKQRHGKKKE